MFQAEARVNHQANRLQIHRVMFQAAVLLESRKVEGNEEAEGNEEERKGRFTDTSGTFFQNIKDPIFDSFRTIILYIIRIKDNLVII
jgi:hypothetical protein